jgi:rhodanese-related sulfurtransferase
MSSKTKRSSRGSGISGATPRTPARSRREEEAALAARRARNGWLARVGGSVVAVVVVLVALWFVVGGAGGSGAKTWTNISVDQLATMMSSKDFTLLNVKTPYIGEIEKTDLYIPYNQLTSRSTELPADKTAKIVVYCRTGNESTIASQTLLDLGYTNIYNLTGGMVAWQSSGRQIIQLNRS